MDANRLAREALRRGGFARVVRGRVRGSRSDTEPCPESKTAEKRLRTLRRAMDKVFACDTAFGTCKDDRPSAGHCMLAAMVVQDLCGGRILAAQVDGIPHYWNRVTTKGGDPIEVDLTGDQFPGRAKVQVGCAPLYPEHEASVFARDPGESLVPEVNEEILALHAMFVRRLAPFLGEDARRVFGSALRRVAPEPEPAPEPREPGGFVYLRVRRPRPDGWHWFIQGKTPQRDTVLAVRIGDGSLRAVPIVAFVEDWRWRKKKVTPQFGDELEVDVYDEVKDALFFLNDSDVGPRLVRLAHDFFDKGSALRRVAPRTDPETSYVFVSRWTEDPGDEPLFWTEDWDEGKGGWVARLEHGVTIFSPDEARDLPRSGMTPSTRKGRLATLVTLKEAMEIEAAWIARLHGSALRRVAPGFESRKDQMPTTRAHERDLNAGMKNRPEGAPRRFHIGFVRSYWEPDDAAWVHVAPTVWRALWEAIVEKRRGSITIETVPVALLGRDEAQGTIEIHPLVGVDRAQIRVKLEAADGERDKTWTKHEAFLVERTEAGFDAMMDRIAKLGWETMGGAGSALRRVAPAAEPARWKKSGTRSDGRLRWTWKIPGRTYVIHKRHTTVSLGGGRFGPLRSRDLELSCIPDEARLDDKGVLDARKVVTLGLFKILSEAKDAAEAHAERQGRVG